MTDGPRTDIEIVETNRTAAAPGNDNHLGVVLPNKVRINGQEVWITGDPIVTIAEDQPVTVNVTLMASSLTVKIER